MRSSNKDITHNARSGRPKVEKGSKIMQTFKPGQNVSTHCIAQELKRYYETNLKHLHDASLKEAWYISIARTDAKEASGSDWFKELFAEVQQTDLV